MARRSAPDSTKHPEQPSQAGAHGPSEGQPTSRRTAKGKPDAGRSKPLQDAARPKGRAAATSSALNLRQQRFVAEYLTDFNATQAAIRAGYSARTAASQGERLLRNVEIAAAVAQAAHKTATKLELTRERVLQETARIAFFDARKLFRDDGSPKSLHELDDDTAAAISGLDVLEEFETRDGERTQVGLVKKYRIADKNSALDRAAKLLALFGDHNKQLTDPLVDLLKGLGRSALPVTTGPARVD